MKTYSYLSICLPLFVLSVGITEPSAAFRAVNGRGIIARLNGGRHCLTPSL